jgi:hypothetical protein
MINMQKILVGLICTLALLAYLMPAAIAEGSQNATANITLNATQNVTANITINETQNATASITLNETQNITESLTQALFLQMIAQKAPRPSPNWVPGMLLRTPRSFGPASRDPSH